MNLPKSTEIAVVGGGPAGSVLAGALARRGRQVVLFERDRFPRDKVCGELLSAQSLDVLQQLGWLDELMALAPPTIGNGVLSTDGAQLHFELPRPALGVSRKRLDAFLFRRAEREGAKVREGIEVTRIDELQGQRRRLTLRDRPGGYEASAHIDADVVVAAYGRRCSLDRQLKRPFFETRSPWVAFKRHHRFRVDGGHRRLDDIVELHAFDGGYCGVSYVEDDIVNVCAMFRTELLAPEGRVDAHHPFCSANHLSARLACRLSELKPANTETQVVAQIPLTRKKPTAKGIFFVGDSASMIAPLAGEGQTMAMDSAMALAKLLDRHLPKYPYRQWTRLWNRRFALRTAMGRHLNTVLTRPSLATPGLRLLQRLPGVANTLVSLIRS